jgi:vacuolar-type H+-ATPase subunit C/Vma6
MFPPFGLFAKIDATLAGLFGPRGLQGLAECSTVAELIDAVRRRPAYEPYLLRLEPGRLTRIDLGGAGLGRTDIERSLARKPPGDLLRLLPFATAERRRFVRALLLGFEVENLKRAIRRLAAGGAKPGAPPEGDLALHDLGPAAVVSPAKLRDAAGLGDLAALLAGTTFHRPVADAMHAAESGGGTLALERAVDEHYQALCWREAGRLSGGDRDGVRALLGVEADVQAIVWAYRGRFLLGLGPENVLPRVPGFGRRLAAAQVRALCEAEGPAAFAALVAAGPYAALAGKGADLSPETLDLRAARVLLAEARAARAGLRFNLGQVVAFLWIAEREVRDIGAVAECIHYRLSPTELERHVVGWGAAA